MSMQNRHSYEFGPFRIDTLNRQLWRDGKVVPLKAKAVDTLLLLIDRRGDVVEKDDLMKSLWPDSFVEESNLTQNIYTLRKALGSEHYIETVPRRGYRFVGEVREGQEPAADILVIKERTRTSISYEEQSSSSPAETIRQSQQVIDVLPQSTLPIRHLGESSLTVRRAHWRWWPLALIIGLIVVGLLIVTRFWRARPPFEKVQLTRFTTTGKAIKAAISPDGRYLAYVVDDAGEKSVWLRQVVTGKDLLIVPPAHIEFFYGLTFSHDGNYIYYVNQEMNHLGMLFQVPSLGGTSTKLAEDVDSPVTLSPDDKRLAFIRGSPGERSITVANVDGTGERKLASTSQGSSLRIGPTWTIPPAWSPDGNTIACAVAATTTEDEYQTIWAFQIDNGAGRSLTSRRWQAVGRMEWLEDGSGLVVTAAEQDAGPAQQIWYVAYPDGTARKVTNDLSDYRDLSLTANGKTLIAVQSERRANIWIAPATDTSRARQLTVTNYDGLDGVSWAPDGKIVYTLPGAGELNLWLVDPVENSPRQLTAHAGLNQQPAVSPDGRYIVFVSNRSGSQHLWRIDVDGTHPQELTHGTDESDPSFTPDSLWVVFRSSVAGRWRILRVSINGGEPVPLSEKACGYPSMSRDGTRIAVVYRPTPAGLNQFAIIPSAGGEPQLIRELPAHYGRFRWTPDGSALAYAAKQEGTGNIWIQPLDGGAPKQLTQWNANPVFSFDWSRDGKWLAYTSGTLVSDVVLITDASH